MLSIAENERDRLENLNTISKVNDSSWAASTVTVIKTRQNEKMALYVNAPISLRDFTIH